MEFTQAVDLVLEFLTESGLHIAICLNIIGSIIKDVERIPDSTIPFILLTLGIAGSVSWANEPTLAECVIQGIYATGAAIGANQLVKQGKEFHEEMKID